MKCRSTALVAAVFLSVGAAVLAFRLEAFEGGNLSLPVLWTVAVSPLLPALCAFLAMDVWSEERRSGRIDLLLSVAVRERDLAVGKFLGTWTVMLLMTLVQLVLSMGLLWFYAPRAFSGSMLPGFVPALLILALQGALWCSTASAASVFFRSAAASLCVSLLLLVALPRGIWAAMMAWSQEGRSAFDEMPFDAHALDFAAGAFSTGTICLYACAIAAMLFIASKKASSLRMVGRGARGLRCSSVVAVALALTAAALASVLAQRLDLRFNLPVGQLRNAFSERTKRILSGCDGEITATSFMPRNDRRFRTVGHFLRSLRRESESLGGARFVLRFVDPRWDLPAAQRLVRRGIREDSVIFEKDRRIATVPLKDGFGELLCASAIQRVATPPVRRNVYWSVGHGESSCDDYGAFGMSDIARALAREGYVNRKIDFASGASVPQDCALLVVAGAKDDFSRFEIGLVESYLRKGGRLLVLASSAERGGVVSMLPAWGMRPMAVSLQNVRTLTGGDVVVSDFSGHELSAPLKGSRIVLGKPIAFAPSAVADAGAGTGKIDFAAVATVDDSAVAAAVERGAGAGSDIAVSPARIVAVGDSGFVMNGMLSARANANRDFFLNCVSYLSGSEAFGAGADDAGVLITGMDRDSRMGFLVSAALAAPVLAFLAMLLLSSARRRAE
jgi:hypothetical protein